MFLPLPNPATGHLENCPLDEVIAHELGHWIAIQHFGRYPEPLVVHGVIYAETPIATKGAGVPFWTSLKPTPEEVSIYTAGHVAERLYREPAVDPTTLLQSFRDDTTCAHDLTSATEIAAAISSDVPAALSRAILASYELLVERLEALVAETTMMVENAVTTKPNPIEIEWSPQLAARLCGGTPDWYG
jgi:hypothetical protein